MDGIPDWWIYIAMAIFFMFMLTGSGFVAAFIFMIAIVSIVVNFSDKSS